MNELTQPPLFRTSVSRPDFDLFDVHANLGISDASEPGYGRLPPAEYIEMMADARIVRACVFPPLLNCYDAANAALLAWAADNDTRLEVFARLGGSRGPRPAREFWQVRKSVRGVLSGKPSETNNLADYSGVKMIPHMSGLPNAATLMQIDTLGLPVLIHAGVHSPPRWIERRLLPRLHGPIILAHLGAYPIADDLLKDAVSLAARHERVYLDTSGIWASEFIRYAAARVPRKLLFGSDAPLTHPLAAWFQIQSALRDDETLYRIGWQNAARLFDAAKRTS